jgi:hypothetical protein
MNRNELAITICQSIDSHPSWSSDVSELKEPVKLKAVPTFRGSISESAGSVYSSKFDREYKVSEVLSAAIYLSEKAGRKVRDIREKGWPCFTYLVVFDFISYM